MNLFKRLELHPVPIARKVNRIETVSVSREPGLQFDDRNGETDPILADGKKPGGKSVAKPGRLQSGPAIAILGVPFDNVTRSEAMQLIEQMVASRQPHYLVTANVDFLVQSLGTSNCGASFLKRTSWFAMAHLWCGLRIF